MHSNENYFSTNLKQIRNKMGLSQGRFAEHLGLSSPQAYRNYEQGRIPRDRQTIEQIANKLGLSVNDLLSGPCSTGENSEPYKVAENGLKKMKTETLEKILCVATEEKDWSAVELIAEELNQRSHK